MVWQDSCFLIIGLGAFTVGSLAKQGKVRAFYWFIPFSYYRNVIYGAIPMGFFLIILGIAGPFLDTFWITPLRVVMIACLFIGIIMWIFEPRFSKPDWVNWLEDQHYDIIPELRHELWQMGPERKAIINDKSKLETWIKDFRQRQT